MKDIIHNLRKQPEHVRKNILHILTIGFGVILVLLWVYSLGTNLTNGDTQAKIGQDVKPFAALKDNIVGGYNSLSDPSTDSNSDANLRAQENSL